MLKGFLRQPRQIDLYIILSVFLALNLVFAFYQTSFFWGNHDWDWVKGTTQVLSFKTGLFEGRYTKFILNVLLFGGQVLPWMNTTVAFALLAVGLGKLCDYWQINNYTDRVLISLMPALAPFILGWLYFPINILGNFAAVLLTAVGLVWAEKKDKIRRIGAVVLFLAALGVYPSVAEMIIVCWGIRYVLHPPQKIKDVVPSAVLIVLSLFLFKVILTGMEYSGIIYAEHYNMQTAAISELISRIPQTAALAIAQLWQTLPFFPPALKYTGLVLILLAMVHSASKRRAVCFFLISFFATVLSAFLTYQTAEAAYMPRINFYGLNFFYAGAAAIGLRQKLFWRNMTFLLSCLFLCLSVKQNLYAQKVWYLGKIAEQQLVERITSRITQTAETSPLTPVIAGEISLRPRYYSEKYHQNSPYILQYSYLIRHIPSGMFNFYAPTPLFYTTAQISEMSPQLYAYLQNVSRPWPAEEALFVDNRYAVIMLTTQGIEAIKAQLPQ